MVEESTAALLRRAASELREQATKAQHTVPWCSALVHGAVRHVRRNVDVESYLLDPCEHPGECGHFGQYDGDYIAMMHPPVALALADWLEVTARSAEEFEWSSVPGHAVAVARAVLREEPTP